MCRTVDDDDAIHSGGWERNEKDFVDPYDYGEVVYKLASGRHSKLEGSFYGDAEVSGLTCHTKFEAARHASPGYTSLQRGTWVVPPHGIPWNALQVVRIISGEVARQKKFVVVLQNPLGLPPHILSKDSRGRHVRLPDKQTLVDTLILHVRARCHFCLESSEEEWWDALSEPWYYVPLKKLRSV